jgi:hypothetical protein
VYHRVLTVFKWAAYWLVIVGISWWLVMLVMGITFSLTQRPDYSPAPEPYGVPRNNLEWLEQFERDYNRLMWGLPIIIPPEATPQNPVGFGMPASHRA